MSEWIYVRNFHELMTGYQKSSYDSTMMPGIGDYFNKLIEQNNQIIELLKKTNETLENIETESRYIYNSIG